MHILTHYRRNKTIITFPAVHYCILQEAVTLRYCAMVEWWLAMENYGDFDKNLLHCQLSPQEQNTNTYPTWIWVFLMNVQRCEDTVVGLYCKVSTNYTCIKQHKIPTSYTEIQLPPTLNSVYILQFLHYNVTRAQKKIILCHAIAVHNRNHNHSKRSYTPCITALSVHQRYCYGTCLPLHTIFLKHTHNSST